MTEDERKPELLSPEQQRAISALFDNLPESYEQREVALQHLRSSFYNELAQRLEPALNAHVKSLPQATWEERRALASWVNQTARHFGLTLVSPRGGNPAVLVAGVVDAGRNPKMRYRFQTRAPAGKRTLVGLYEELPDLKLMQAPLRIENFSKEFRRGSDEGPNR